MPNGMAVTRITRELETAENVSIAGIGTKTEAGERSAEIRAAHAAEVSDQCS